jgi:uncharacterized membrane protein
MSKADFFLQLQDRLRGLPAEERHNIMQVYEDLFRQAEAGGKTEQEIIQSLGFIPVPMNAPAPAERQRRSMGTFGPRNIIAAVALFFFNLIFILGPFIAVSAVLFSFSLVAVLFTFSSVWVIIGTGIPTSADVLLLEVFTSLTLSGLGVMLGIGMWKLGRGYIALVKRYTALNFRLIRGE